eukprot:scaffold8897_cov16-Tisochrysis_lutea.AAC.1
MISSGKVLPLALVQPLRPFGLAANTPLISIMMTGGRLLHRVGEVGRQLRNNANMLWANAMKEPHERHGRERSSVDDDQWLGGQSSMVDIPKLRVQEPEEEGHSFTYTEKSMGSMWA